MPSIKITKADGAPEGDIKVSLANLHFKVSDDSPYETDDPNVALAIRDSFSEFFTVEYADEADVAAAARQDAKDFNKLLKEQDKAEKARAEKDPMDPAPVKPETVEDVKTTASEGGK